MPNDFYNFWGTYRTLREDAVPSVFPFITKKKTARRQLIRIGCDEFIVEQCGSEDKSDDQEVIDEAESSSCNVEESVEEQGEVDAQLEAANDEIVKLKQMLDKARLEITELRKNVSRKRFGIKLVRESDKDVHFYTGLPSAAVFDRLLEYLSPDGRRSNIVYQATAKKWASDCIAGAEPGEAKWRDSDSQVG